MDAVRQRFCRHCGRPCRVAREQAVHKPDLVDDHRTEDDVASPVTTASARWSRANRRAAAAIGIGSAVVMGDIPAIAPTPKTSR